MFGYTRRVTLLVTLSITLPLLPISSTYSAEKIIISSGKRAPFNQLDGKGFYQLLVKELFKRIGIEAKAVALASERSLVNANSGIDDGNIARVKGLEKKYPNLVRVPEHVFVYDFMGFSKNKTIKLKNWDALSNYNVGYITGWKIFEKKITHTKSLTKVRNPDQLFTLLKNDRTEIVMYDRWGGLWWLKSHGINAQPIEPPLASKNMFLYMNKKHKDLIPLLTKTIVEMKKDGFYQRIYETTLKRIK